MGRSDQDNGTSWFNRRDILRAAGATTMIGAASGYNVQPASAQGSRASNDAPLGLRLQGVQHFGLTVQRMDRARAQQPIMPVRKPRLTPGLCVSLLRMVSCT